MACASLCEYENKYTDVLVEKEGTDVVLITERMIDSRTKLTSRLRFSPESWKKLVQQGNDRLRESL